MTLNDLCAAPYIALETFRKNGQAVKTPVWQAAEGDKFYVWTQADSGKAKRIRRNGRVRVCQSDGRGAPQSDWLEAQARLLTSVEEQKVQHKRMAAKYGWQFWAFYLLAQVRRAEYVVIEISPA